MKNYSMKVGSAIEVGIVGLVGLLWVGFCVIAFKTCMLCMSSKKNIGVHRSFFTYSNRQIKLQNNIIIKC